MRQHNLLTGFFLLFASLTLSAQQGTQEHRFHSDQLPDALLIKQVHQVVNDLDPNSSLSVHQSLMKARMNVAVAHGELIDALNGIGPVLFTSGWPAETQERTAASALAFPTWTDTGDPVQDSIAFAIAKQAWAAANPHLVPAATPDQ